MRLPILLPFIILAACATVSPEARVRDKLLEAGVGPRMAQCLAERLTDRLSIGQLKQLGRVASLPGRRTGQLTLDELVERLGALGDPEIVRVVASSGIGCAIAS